MTNEMKTKISTLWVVVMFNMLFADVLPMQIPEFLQELIQGTTDVKITEEMMLLSAVLIVGGAEFALHYYFFAVVQLVCLSAIVWSACTGRAPSIRRHRQELAGAHQRPKSTTYLRSDTISSRYQAESEKTPCKTPQQSAR